MCPSDTSEKLKVILYVLRASSGGKFAIFHFDEPLNNSPHIIEKERGLIDYLTATTIKRDL